MSATSFAEDGSRISAAMTMILRSGDEAAASTSFFVSRRAEELVVAVKMRPVAPAWAKALTVTIPILRLAPMMTTTKGEGSFWVEGVRDVEGVLLSLVVKFMPVHTGAAIFAMWLMYGSVALKCLLGMECVKCDLGCAFAIGECVVAVSKR